MRRTFYHLLTTVAALLISATLFAQQSSINVLYVAADDPAAGGDAFVIDSLVAMGYNVTPLVASAFNEFSHTDFSADVIVFGEKLSSSAVTPFANASFPTPCVSLEGFCVRENRWALTTNDNFGQVLSADQAPEVIADPAVHFGITVDVDHPVTAYAGLAPGTTVKWTAETDSLPEVTYFDLPQAAATAVADIEGEDGRTTLWAIEPDANDADNPLNHRLVIWGVHDNGLEAGLANPVFYDIMDGAILWVMDQNTASGIIAPEAVSHLNVYPNPVTNRADIRFTLEQPGHVTLEVLDLAGKRIATQDMGQFTIGEQRVAFVRPAAMAAGMYHFNLRLDGKPVGTGKVIVE